MPVAKIVVGEVETDLEVVLVAAAVGIGKKYVDYLKSGGIVLQSIGGACKRHTPWW